jgi:hypothetical protein
MERHELMAVMSELSLAGRGKTGLCSAFSSAEA